MNKLISIVVSVFVCFNYVLIVNSAEGESSFQQQRQSFVDNGIAVEFFVEPLNRAKNGDSKTVTPKTNKDKSNILNVRAGDSAIVNIMVSDVHTHSPIKGLLPDSFVQYKPIVSDLRLKNISMKRCRFRALKRGRMHGGHAPLLENTYLLCLNSIDNSLSVINPMLKPKTVVKRIPLGEKCNDLSIDEYTSNLYITCQSGKVIVIDCQRFEEIKRIDVGSKPYHVEFQPDGFYVWVGNDGDGSISVINTETLEVVKNIKTGHGHHEIVFNENSLYAYITNDDNDDLTVVDIAKLEIVKSVKTGESPRGVAYSKLSQHVYIANEGSNNIAVFDTVLLKVIKLINVGKKPRSLVFEETGRYCFVVNKNDNSVSVIDTSRDFVMKTIPVGIRPEGIVLAEQYGYVRNTGSPDVTIIDIQKFERVDEVAIGWSPPNSVDLSEGHIDIDISYMVIIPDPVDNIVYTIMNDDTDTAFKYRVEGKGPSKVAFYWIGLKEVFPGKYSRVIHFDKPGRYEIGMYVDSPEVIACFEVIVVE